MGWPNDKLNAIGLDGRGILVLGAGGDGIGAETSRYLARAGARLLCVDRRDDQARAIADETGGEAIAADVTDRVQMGAIFSRAEAAFGDGFYGVVDIVGLAEQRDLAEFDDESIERLLNGNLRHALMAAQIAGPTFARLGGGSIAFVSSLAGSIVAPGQALYGIAKAGLQHLVRYAASEYGPGNVRVNAIAPGLIITPGVEAMITQDMKTQLSAGVPLPRLGVPGDIAGALLFLMSDLSSYITGSTINVDGGRAVGPILPRL